MLGSFPNFDKDINLSTGALGFSIGSVLMQQDDNGKHCVIAYSGRLLNKAKQNYDVTQCENLSVILALRHFRELILGYKILILTDH